MHYFIVSVEFHSLPSVGLTQINLLWVSFIMPLFFSHVIPILLVSFTFPKQAPIAAENKITAHTFVVAALFSKHS